MGAGPAPLLRTSQGLASNGERGGEAPSTWRGSPDLGPGQGKGIGVGLIPLLWQRGADKVPEGTSPATTRMSPLGDENQHSPKAPECFMLSF